METVLHIIAHQIWVGDRILDAALILLAGWAVLQLALVLDPSLGARLAGWRSFAWQLGGLLGLEQAYELLRGRIPGQMEIADAAWLNGYRLHDFELRHGFFLESRIERFFLHFRVFMNGVDLFYALCHVGVTVGVIVWIYLRHREFYATLRSLLVVTTGIALVVFYVFPTAPPRMFSVYGFVDPAVLHHLVPDGEAQLGSYTYNPYAAMPSLHVAYAVLAAVALIAVHRQVLVRVLAALYPFAMSAAVVISGNHWLLDVAGGFVTVALAAVLLAAASTVYRSIAAWLARDIYPLSPSSPEQAA